MAPEAAAAFGGRDAIVPLGMRIATDTTRSRVAGDDATVPARISAPGKPTENVLLYLVRRGEQWELVATGRPD